MACGCGQRPGSQFLGEPGLFGDGDELGGADRSENGVGPPGEGFDGDDAVGSQVDQGLVVHRQLAAVQRRAQVHRQGADALGVVDVVEIERAVATADPGALRPIHREVGAVDHLTPGRIRLGQGDTDAGAQRCQEAGVGGAGSDGVG